MARSRGSLLDWFQCQRERFPPWRREPHGWHHAAALRPCRLLCWPTSHPADGEPAHSGPGDILAICPTCLFRWLCTEPKFTATSKTLLQFPISLGCASLGMERGHIPRWLGWRNALRQDPAVRTKEPGGAQHRGRGSSHRRSGCRASRTTAVETELCSSRRGVSLALRLPF